MSVPNFRKSYHMGFEKNCRKSRLSKQFDKTGNNNRFPPDGGTLNIAAGSNGGFLLNIPIRDAQYHFFTNRYEYEYFYLCTCRYRVPIPILLRFGLHESAINLEADFILSSADYVKPIVQN